MTDLPSFEEIKNNFYVVAKDGWKNTINWYGKNILPHELILETLLPQAKIGMEHLNISAEDIEKYLSIIDSRVSAKQTGADWQRNFVASHKCDMVDLISAYQTLQNTESPVHTWNY